MVESKIRYGHWLDGIQNFPVRLRALVDELRPGSISEVGGGANPELSLKEVRDRGARYTVLDISQAELDKAPDGYEKVSIDITYPHASGLEHAYDFVFSNMLAEHVKHPRQFHRNVYEMLTSGGAAAHFMPTLYDPMFVANRLLPEVIGERLVRKAQPERKLTTTEAKFPAYYRWCRGPSRRQIENLEHVGFEVVEMTGYFGSGYLQRTPLERPYEAVTKRLIEHPVDKLCSYAWVVLRRPLNR